MHIRISIKRQGKQVYRYAQLVESYRRPDGMPAVKVIASLGRRSDEEVANLRLALQASRQGRTLVIPEREAHAEWKTRVLANLEYLDLAVALATWERSWKLSELLNRLMPQGLEAIAPSAVVAALVLQRCVAPGSKLYAQRWFPKTALPELLGVAPEHFNNTRIHRVLEQLDRVDGALQEALPLRYEQRDGVFATLFMDVTDAWFAGRGCEMAERNRTKEGFRNRRKIGIVLLCNERGYPLRWQVVPGKRRDAQCMEEMLDVVKKTPWFRDAPLVCDRAMGRATSISKLLASGLRFLTATARSDIESYTKEIPSTPFLELDPVGSDVTEQAEIEAAGRTALAAGLRKVDDLLYVLDLGVCERPLVFDEPSPEATEADWDPQEMEGGASFLALARIFQQRIERKEARNRAELAKQEGLTRARVTQIMNLLKLDARLQERLLRGEFGYAPERLLRQCIRYRSEAKQRRLLEEHAQQGTRRAAPSKPPLRTGRQQVGLKLAAYFNPRMFVEQRALHCKHRREAEDFVADLNRRLRSARSRMTEHDVHAAVLNELGRHSLIRLFRIRIQPDGENAKGDPCLQAHLELNEEEWDRKRRYAGFVLLVAHPDLPHTAEQMVRLYRDKDTVEKDFQTIKDVVELRPMHHHTDPKIRAHVTLCMLALLLERTIEGRLRRSSTPMTAPACFETLHGCHLNLVRSDANLEPAYLTTEPTQEQQTILRSLRMLELTDPEDVAQRITARQLEN